MSERKPHIEARDWTGVADPYNPGMTYPEAWAIQREVGETLSHLPRCSSVPGWDPMSGPHWLCDCGAVLSEWKRRRTPTATAVPEGPGVGGDA